MQFSISMIIISLLLHLKASGTRKGRDFQVGGWGIGFCGGKRGRRYSEVRPVSAVRRRGMDVAANPLYSHCAPAGRNSAQEVASITLPEENGPRNAAGLIPGCIHGKPRLRWESREVSHPSRDETAGRMGRPHFIGGGRVSYPPNSLSSSLL